VTGNHSGLKDRKCTDDPALHPTMANVQSDDIPFVTGANPLFVTAAANANVSYLASDTSQINQAVEQYISGVNDGSTTDRLILPRWPTNIFYNVSKPSQLVDEYNYIYYDQYVSAGQNPCTEGGICAKRTYADILTAEATAAVQHMLSFKKYPHFFHQANVAKYNNTTEKVLGGTTTIQFDWLNSVYTAYEKLFKLPVKNLPYYQIGDMTRDSLTAKSAVISATWDRTANMVKLSSNIPVSNLLVTGVKGGVSDLYGGQYIVSVTLPTANTVITMAVDQALTQ
jgi:hypothetical protein